MFPKRIDRRQMERAMRQMGVKMDELEGVREVVIKLADREIVISNAQVTRTEMAGQRSYQVSGQEFERKPEFEPSEDDVKLVMEQAGVEREAAMQVLKETGGDIAEAILKLKEKG
ncbi:MAG: nascent polypeptide-associated complex protein [Candidatus Hadarchaeaceae archaeon]|nr:nascent polypeptide-associated complex protein [Hadesarchaea archaeon]MDH5685425.1 nascent polypeptide-associated complex protein [Hadesarchaea archaeon]